MGVNIIVYKINGILTEEGFHGQPIPYFDKERFAGWDSLRYSGDRDFNTAIEFDYISDGDQEMSRPKDFQKAREWAKTLPEGNQERWIKIFDLMENNSQLYFYFSW